MTVCSFALDSSLLVPTASIAVSPAKVATMLKLRNNGGYNLRNHQNRIEQELKQNAERRVAYKISIRARKLNAHSLSEGPLSLHTRHRITVCGLD
jgi:hypothetical protein